MFKPGQIVGGDFEILDLIGRGGMGAVYRARQRSLDRIVCLKVPHPEFREDVFSMKRFEDEARTIARINHPNIVAIYLVHLPDSEEDMPYLVMEYAPGKNLQEHLQIHRQRLTVGSLLDIFLQICDGLEAAHEAKIVHRDIKPGNIVITEVSNTVKIMDFGIAKIQRLDSVNQQATIVGTPAFMPPEQVRGDPPTPAADLYSLGAMCWVLFAQRPMFEGSGSTVVNKQLTEQAPSIRDYNKAIPAELDALILKCLDKAPQNRPGSAQELATELERILRPFADKPLRQLIPETTEAAEALALAQASTMSPQTRSRARLILAVSFLTGALIALLFVWRIPGVELRAFRRGETLLRRQNPVQALPYFRIVLNHSLPSWMAFLDRDERSVRALGSVTSQMEGSDPWRILEDGWERWVKEMGKPLSQRSDPKQVFGAAIGIEAMWKRLAPDDSEGRAYSQALDQKMIVANRLLRLEEAANRGDQNGFQATAKALASLFPDLPEFQKRLQMKSASLRSGSLRTSSGPEAGPLDSSSGSKIPESPTATPSPSLIVSSPAPPTPSLSPTAPPTPEPTASPSPVPTPPHDPQKAAGLIRDLESAILEGPDAPFFKSDERCNSALAQRYREMLRRLAATSKISEARFTMLQYSVRGKQALWTGKFVIRGRSSSSRIVVPLVTIEKATLTLRWRNDQWILLDTDLPFDKIAPAESP